MKTRPSEQADAERAVMAYKHSLAVKVMRFIINELAFRRLHFHPGNVPADIVAKEHRQGVVSNAWGSLKSLEIIEPLKLTDTFPDLGIWAGRTANTNDGAKGRPVLVYRLKSRAAALTWLERNPEPEARPLVPGLPPANSEPRKVYVAMEMQLVG